MGLHVGDRADHVLRNRDRLARSAGLDPERAVWAEQVHGAGVAVVGPGDVGRGARDHAEAVRGVDALVTKVSHLPLALLAADCVLVALHDPVAGVLGLAHAGWRGTAAGVLEATLDALVRLGARPDRTEAALSSAIGPCCYEVSPEVAGQVGEDHAIEIDGRTMLDLPGAVAARLRSRGVPLVTAPPGCTRCRSETWFSYRAATDGRTGRHAVLAWLPTGRAATGC